MSQKSYKQYFKDKLQKYGIESPADLSKDEKSKFFDEVATEWDSLNESIKDKPPIKAIDAYIQTKTEIKISLESIAKGIIKMDKLIVKTPGDWSIVGSMQHINELLNEISEFLGYE
jgi:hypothetical protein